MATPTQTATTTAVIVMIAHDICCRHLDCWSDAVPFAFNTASHLVSDESVPSFVHSPSLTQPSWMLISQSTIVKWHALIDLYRRNMRLVFVTPFGLLFHVKLETKTLRCNFISDVFVQGLHVASTIGNRLFLSETKSSFGAVTLLGNQFFFSQCSLLTDWPHNGNKSKTELM